MLMTLRHLMWPALLARDFLIWVLRNKFETGTFFCAIVLLHLSGMRWVEAGTKQATSHCDKQAIREVPLPLSRTFCFYFLLPHSAATISRSRLQDSTWRSCWLSFRLHLCILQFFWCFLPSPFIPWWDPIISAFLVFEFIHSA